MITTLHRKPRAATPWRLILWVIALAVLAVNAVAPRVARRNGGGLDQANDSGSRANGRPAGAPDTPEARLRAIADWIGRPSGRGRIFPARPELGVEREVRVWEAEGELGVRQVKLVKLLGSGLAGTVFLAEDDAGAVFIEKHYGAVPAFGSKQLGRKFAAAVFALFRQAPLSFRELPEAVVASHLANRVIVATSRARDGRPITPPILYTRYDEVTGGYAQAFTYVQGRPLRPWQEGLPLLGEAGVFYRTMQDWRDFLAKELGFWGLARQVDPANLNSYSNLWITPDEDVLLLDIVPGVPGFLELRYLWWGLTRGQFAPFGDAVDFRRLRAFLERNPLEPSESWRRDLLLLELAVECWQDSEPRLPSSPLRVLRVIRAGKIRAATRASLLTHLEVKGAITAQQAHDYREDLSRSGGFPRLLRHSLLKMAPLSIHRVLTDRAEALRVFRKSWMLPLRAAAWAGPRLRSGLARLGRLALLAGRMLVNHDDRVERCRAIVGDWIESEEALGRLTWRDARSLEETLNATDDTADLAGLFALHLLISALKHSLFGPSLFWLGAALATGRWWLAIPVAIAPVLRVLATIWIGLGRRLGLLFLCALPDVGVLAAPFYLLQRRPQLGGFIIRSMVQKAALKVPAFGERGALAEMLGVAAAQVLLVGPGRMLPLAIAAAIVGAAKHVLWVSWASFAAYGVSVAWSWIKIQRGAQAGRGQADWKYGLPDDDRAAISAARLEPAPAQR